MIEKSTGMEIENTDNSSVNGKRVRCNDGVDPDKAT